MSSIVIKVGSLVIKTLSKPIANKIKAQARDHERFRRVCVNVAQGIHRWDMRFRLGLLQDTAAIEKQIAKDAAEAKAKKQTPTVKTEAQAKADEAAEKRKDSEEKGRETKKPPKIRPLSEAKAIDLGANFVSETFLLAVGISLIFFENWRKGRQETSRQEGVTDRIDALEAMTKSFRRGMVSQEKEILRLRVKAGEPNDGRSFLPAEIRELEEAEEEQDEIKKRGWLSWLRNLTIASNSKTGPDAEADSTDKNKANENRDDTPVATTLSKIFQSRSHPRDILSESQSQTAQSHRPEPLPEAVKSQSQGH